MSIGIIMALLIVAMVLALSLKSRNPEISSLVSIAVCLVIVFLCVERIRTILSGMNRIINYIHIDRLYIGILIKLIGIAYICEFAAGISKDAGYQAIASQIELVGKLTMLMVSMPVLMQVLNTILELL
ncbi:MAG: SpoIIIAC/SpoIIIAD family protein [Lachnospiraceae bacterium]|nr:SpoIIIAC/SpoIIIAD family protein [Lachnospiraceae bacterium]